MNLESFTSLHPVMQAFLAGTLTWGLTAAGALAVFLTREFNQKFLDTMQGFAAGVMIAASYWSLLEPAIAMSEGKPIPPWVPPAVGFLLGGAFLYGFDKILPHLHSGLSISRAEGIRTSWERSILLVLAITLHNIPEGLAIGVAFGAIATGLDQATLSAAIALTIGIGIQNAPEGLAVALPLRREGVPARKCFFYGQLSALVEPFAAAAGAAAVFWAQPILPYALSFAAGAMIYVVIEELIPESHRNGHSDVTTLGAMVGFTVMMILDLAFR